MDNEFRIGLLAGLDSRSKQNLENEIEALNLQLKDISVANETVNKIKDQIESIKVELKDVTISQESLNRLVTQVNEALKGINLSQLSTQTGDIGVQIGNQISNGVKKANTEINRATKETESFLKLSETISKNNNILNYGGDNEKLKTYADLFDHIKNTYKEFGTVKINDMKFDDSGHLERFRVNLEQVDGDLKETRSFVMKLNEETDMFSFDGMIKGAESIVQHLDKTKNAVNKTAEEVNAAKIKMQTEGIQGKINTGDYETQVNRLIAETQRWTNENGEARVSTSNLSNALVELNSVNTQLNTAEGNTIANHERLIAAEQRLSEEIKKTKNSVSLLKTEMATDKQINNLRNNIQKFYDINSKASKEAKAQLSGFISELDKGSVTKARLDQINNSFKQLEGTLRQTGNLGKNWFDTLKANAGSFVPWLTTTGAIMKGVQAVKDGISTVKELDYTLVDLRKTANMTSQQLNDFYYTSNDVAKQMGVTTQEIIEQASEFSRLGYNTAEQATKMAEYSSMFKMISPGMDISQATDGLVSVMKAKIFYQFLNAFVYRNMYIANI